ncbi:hypothetical protein AAC387_Pa07g0457 [Persea americana]
MNSSTTSEASVWGNWNSSTPPIMSFVGLESNTQKQFWEWGTSTNASSTHNNVNHPFIIPTTSFTDFSSTSAPTNFPLPYPQINHCSSSMANLFLKREDGCSGVDGGSCGNARIGLNLGHRTYFSSRETAVMDRLFKRSRGFYQANQIPRCQVEGCNVDLTNAKQYHKRHRVCEFHSKATKVVLAGGLEQRFCQQCSRFHALCEFDEVKRSCRKRLADHNRRRRKPHPGITSDSGARKKTPNSIEKTQEAETRTRVSPFPLLMTKDNKFSKQEESNHFQQKLATPQLQKGPALSLSGARAVQRSCESQYTYTHQPFSSTSSLFDREPVSSSSCVMINRNCYSNNLLNEASQSTGARSNQAHQQQPEELQNFCSWVMPCSK